MTAGRDGGGDDVRDDDRDDVRGDDRGDGAADRGRGHHRDPLLAWLRVVVPVALMVVLYFLLPLHLLGTQTPVLSWTLFAVALGVVTALLLREIRAVLMEVPHARPGVTIPLLTIASLLVFAAAYNGMARGSAEFHGLRTRVDALYFTVATVATVGYGDITARGQLARILVMGQIMYSFVFLTAAATALSRRVRRALGEGRSGGRRHGKGRRRGGGRHGDGRRGGGRQGDGRRGGGTGPGGRRPGRGTERG
ncbi:potassium channel family protein [Streptomyces sp. NPDC004134]|uniref:potassium channel family protein n=1 Tax=Streptomyces sp. NPDC004134 TaxID=3364691 RepID=UPI0036A0A7F5